MPKYTYTRTFTYAGVKYHIYNGPTGSDDVRLLIVFLYSEYAYIHIQSFMIFVLKLVKEKKTLNRLYSMYIRTYF